MEKTNIIILAGGLGKRMNSDLPKVLNKINNKPMIVNIIETVLDLNINKIFIIVGKYKNIIQTTIEDYIKNDFIEYVLQEEALGTGHAIQCCYNKLLLKLKVNLVKTLCYTHRNMFKNIYRYVYYMG